MARGMMCGMDTIFKKNDDSFLFCLFILGRFILALVYNFNPACSL